jgi:hypothetical protein
MNYPRYLECKNDHTEVISANLDAGETPLHLLTPRQSLKSIPPELIKMAAMVETRPKDVIVGDPVIPFYLEDFPDKEQPWSDTSWLGAPGQRRQLTAKEKVARKAKRNAIKQARKIGRR